MSDISSAVKIEDISAVKKKLSFDVPWADVKSELDAVYRKVGKTAKIKGFRPGKIPREILERHYREDAEGETISNLVNRYYWETLQQKDIPAVTQPEIEQQGIEAEKDFTFSATVEVEPAVEPKDYLGLELEKEEPVVTDEDLEARMAEIRQMFATMEEVEEDRAIRMGDFVTLDFTGAVAGEQIKELKSESYLLEIGSKTFVPGFEEQLVGLRQGEAKTVAVKFPDNYNAAHLAGKDVEFTVNIKGIRVKKLPEIDEQFIKNFERYESLEALKADVLKNLEEEKKRKIELDFEKQISDKLLEKNIFDVPDSFVKRQIYYMMSDMQRRMVSGGMDRKKAAEFSMKLHDHFREEASKIVKTVLLLKGIAGKEALTAGEDEVEKQIREIAAQQVQDYETLRKSLEKDGLIDNIRSEILKRMTYAFLEAKAKVTTVRTEKKGIPEGKK
ncbi:MAG: trigger factor [Proteobacteria bacterium]|nr:trigger factor [Pseudomonadota bacterium]MBU4582040.1 trigger factor [Pseudomonadota bacterium]MCG2738698.1 trigger factor [Syntrophaceae bacterium]